MKTQNSILPRKSTVPLAALAIALALVGCDRDASQQSNVGPANIDAAVSPLAIVLARHAGDGRIDAEIRKQQDRARTGTNQETTIERIGWLFVGKARESFDPGYYKLAEQCALYLKSRNAGSPEALLLLGHALQSQHRFLEAETLARELVTQRGLSFDYGLLGDILVDLGRVREAAGVYQQMLDQKPDPQGYARSAHIRWLTGDLSGALELMRMAARGVSAKDFESAAWMHTQLARYSWQAQDIESAEDALRIALEFQKDYPPALLLRGRMLLANGRTDEAIASLRLAAQGNPLPEYQWTFSDALRSARLDVETRQIESQLLGRGASSDPRTCSLYLATRGDQTTNAVKLARQELKDRQDIFTHDALAWALAAAGDISGAQNEMALALAEGTHDARLFLHAAVIATKAGQLDEGREWITKLTPLLPMLLPSEREHLDSVRPRLSGTTLSSLSQAATTASALFPARPNDGPAKEN